MPLVVFAVLAGQADRPEEYHPVPRHAGEQHRGDDLGEERGRDGLVHEVDLAVLLHLDDGRREPPALARTDPDEPLPVGLPNGYRGDDLLNGLPRREVLRQPQPGGVERIVPIRCCSPAASVPIGLPMTMDRTGVVSPPLERSRVDDT